MRANRQTHRDSEGDWEKLWVWGGWRSTVKEAEVSLSLEERARWDVNENPRANASPPRPQAQWASRLAKEGLGSAVEGGPRDTGATPGRSAVHSRFWPPGGPCQGQLRGLEDRRRCFYEDHLCLSPGKDQSKIWCWLPRESPSWNWWQPKTEHKTKQRKHYGQKEINKQFLF